MEKTFTVATDNIDSDGDKIIPGALKMPNKPVYIFKDFDYSKKIGTVESITEKSGEFIVTAKMTDEYFDLTPAIGFDVIESHMEGDVRVLDNIKLYCVSLNSSPNVDDHVKTIGQQTGND